MCFSLGDAPWKAAAQHELCSNRSAPLPCLQWIVYQPNGRAFECVCDAEAYAENIRCAMLEVMEL